MKGRLTIILILCFAFFNSQNTISEVHKIPDITYKTSDSIDHKLDIYLPRKSEKKFPILVFLHGGGWIGGDKAFPEKFYMNDFVLKFVQNGYAVVSVNYTLLDKNTNFPKPIEDSKEAVRWIRANADKYNFDEKNIGLWGASAGAQIGMVAAYSDDSQFSENSRFSNYSSKVNYVIDYFGPSDLNKLLRTEEAGFKIFIFKLIFPKIYKMRNDMIRGFTTKDITVLKQEAIDGLKVYSPVTYINQNSVPTLIIHGDKDRIVPFSQSEILKKKLDEHQVTNELIPIDKGDHGLNEEADHQLMMEKTLEFMKQNTH
jgi:acetyl esterase/lipase